MKVLRIKTSDNIYGGNKYEDAFEDCLKQLGYEVITKLPTPKIKSKIKYILFPLFFYRLWLYERRKSDYNIRSLETSFFLSNYSKNIVIAHHYDPSYSNFFSKYIQKLAFNNLLHNKNRIYKLIVVSKFWKEYFEKLGFNNIEIIK